MAKILKIFVIFYAFSPTRAELVPGISVNSKVEQIFDWIFGLDWAQKMVKFAKNHKKLDGGGFTIL